jgi:hypothetical protein
MLTLAGGDIPKFSAQGDVIHLTTSKTNND